MTTKAKVKPADDNELEFLRARVRELESSKDEGYDVAPDTYIPVMSLLPYPLNLSTREAGRGNVKKFTRFGEVKRIIYSDLVDIMEVHSNFLEAGFFYIMNPLVIRHHGLDEIYSKILTKEKIEQILSTTSTEECLSLYKSANSKQQETIVELVIEKLVSEPDSVDLNVVDRLSRESHVKISERASEIRSSLPVAREEEVPA